MAVFAWRARETRHFGTQWVAYAELHLRSVKGAWHEFSVQVDTGAVVSVLPSSAATLLGMPPKSGTAVEMSGIGGPARRYFLHRMVARIGEDDEFPMRIAIAEREDAPSLLGRLDVLDRFQLDFDPSLEELRISLPWLDEGGRKLWRLLIQAEEDILKRWNANPLPGRADEAARRLINRADQLLMTGAALVKLHRAFDLPLMIRSLLDISLQFEYIMRDPEPRATLYLDYEHVTKYRREQAWLNLPGPIGDDFRNSPRRSRGARRILNEYNRVGANYSSRNRTVRDHWYPETLRKLAEELGRREEYDAFYGLYSSWAHGDPWTADRTEVGHGGLMHVFIYWSRVMIQIADAKKIILSGEPYQVLERLAKGWTAT